MTDNEIIKALEYCSSHDDCDLKCPIAKETTVDEGCIRTIGRLALDIINRQKAEIERLKPFEEKIAEYNSSIRVEDMLVFASSLEEWLEFCDNLKAEAYKEFAERLKIKSEHFEMEKENFVSETDIDNLLAEMEEMK